MSQVEKLDDYQLEVLIDCMPRDEKWQRDVVVGLKELQSRRRAESAAPIHVERWEDLPP